MDLDRTEAIVSGTNRTRLSIEAECSTSVDSSADSSSGVDGEDDVLTSVTEVAVHSCSTTKVDPTHTSTRAVRRGQPLREIDMRYQRFKM